MDATNHYLVALDPTAEAGEAAVPLATYAAGITGGRLTLLVALEGPASRALHERAASEETTVATAANRYLDQVIAEVRSGGVMADGVTINGTDPAGEILGILDGSDVTAVALPIAGRTSEERLLDELARRASVPVVLVPAA